MTDYDARAHAIAAAAARNAYDDGKQLGGSARGYRHAHATYLHVYELHAGQPFPKGLAGTDRWPGIWKR